MTIQRTADREIAMRYLSSNRGNANEYKRLVSRAREIRLSPLGRPDALDKHREKHAEDTWDDEPSELSRVLQRSLDRNSEDTTVPTDIALIQAKAVRNQTDE